MPWCMTGPLSKMRRIEAIELPRLTGRQLGWKAFRFFLWAKSMLATLLCLCATLGQPRPTRCPGSRSPRTRSPSSSNRPASRSSPWGFNYDHDDRRAADRGLLGQGMGQGGGPFRPDEEARSQRRPHPSSVRQVHGRRRQAQREGPGPARRSSSAWPRRNGSTST